MATRGSAEWKINISRSRMGQPWSAAKREAILAGKKAARLKRLAMKREILRSSLSQRFSGPGNPCYGKPVSEERRKKISLGVKRAWAEGRFSREHLLELQLAGRLAALAPEARLKKSNNRKRLFREHPEARAKLSKSQKKNWQNIEFIARFMRSIHARPNKMELKLNALLEELVPGVYLYNGDFSAGISIGGLVPDWVDINGQKKAIELFGKPWHTEEEEAERRDVFARYGWDLLIIWSTELREQALVKARILAFQEARKAMT